MDGRTEVYGPKFFEEYQKVWRDGNKEIFESDVKKYNLTGVFLNGASQRIPPKVLRMIYNLPDWRMVYINDDAVIFLRKVPANEAIIERNSIDLAKWKVRKLNLMRIGPRRVAAFPLTDLGAILEALDFDNQALAQLKEALKVAPEDDKALVLMGRIYQKHKNYVKSFEYYRLAAMVNPHEARLRSHLGLAYENLGDQKNAIMQYQRAINLDDHDVEAYIKLIALLQRSGKIAAAKEYIVQAGKLFPEEEQIKLYQKQMKETGR